MFTMNRVKLKTHFLFYLFFFAIIIIIILFIIFLSIAEQK